MQTCDDVAKYARQLAVDCEVDSAVVFISDKTAPATRLHYLGNFGVSEEILRLYHRYGICDADPFTDALNAEDCVGGTFRAINDRRIARCGSRADRYWDFVSQYDIEVVGAGTLRLQPRMYLTVGVHRRKGVAYRGPVPMERLAFGIDVLQNRIAASLLSRLLENGKSYQSLLQALGGDEAAPRTPNARLSARETQVARLVCEGRRNKQIAWIAGLSECTVENHLRRIYQKLGIHNRAALVAQMTGLLG